MEIIKDQQKMQTFLSSVDYRVVRTREELESAYALVYKEYLKRQYVREISAQMRYSLFNILPTTTTFIALCDNQIIATASVIVNSPLGLPMDDLYKDELDELRVNDKKICEISMLASDTSLFPEGTSLMLNAKKMFLVYNLFKCVFDYVKDVLQMDNICIAINPKHNLTYDHLFFRDLGPLKKYDQVNGAPALGKCLDVKEVEPNCASNNRLGIQKLFFQKSTDPQKFDNKMVLQEKDIKELFMQKFSLLQEADSDELQYISQCYPMVDFLSLIPTQK